MKSVFYLVLLIGCLRTANAQKVPVIHVGTVQVLNNKIAYYRKKTSYLTKQTKRLFHRLWKLTNRHKKIVVSVQSLIKGSMELSRLLDSSYVKNNSHIITYESRIVDMNKTLSSLNDSMATLQVVKNEIGLLKKYLSTSSLGEREDDLVKDDLLKLLNDYFDKANSPYEIVSVQANQLVVRKTAKRVLAVFRKEIAIYGDHTIDIVANPSDQTKTILNISQSLGKKKVHSVTADYTIVPQPRKEKELLSCIDRFVSGAIY